MTLSRRQLIAGGVGATALALPMLANSQATAVVQSDLQQQVNRLVKQKRRIGEVASNERTAWSVYDFYTQRKLVSINEERPMQAASMVKVFVALAFFYLNSQNAVRYAYNSSRQKLMKRMLVYSSNHATNSLMQLCGGPSNIARLCQKATGYRFKQLRIVEYIPAGGRTYRNRISARDYSRFLYDLWHGSLPHSQEIKRIMSIKNGDRIRTDVMPEDLLVVDKTGSTGQLCGNMGIVQLDANKAYTFIGIIEKSRKTSQYSRWIRGRGEVMRDVSALIYQFMDERYRLLGSIG